MNYLGQIWGGKVFDTTFTRQLSGFPIGVGQVIPGWDTAIVGKRVGSRLLLVIPPKDGYGSKGNSAIGVTATSTMVFVIDIVAEYNSSVTADPKATPVANVVNGITISGSMTSAAKVTIASGTAQPTAANVTLVDRGHGKNIKPGLVILQTVVTNWSGVTQASTWTLGTPDAETVGQTSNPSLLDKLVGMPIGSRFLAVIPKTSGQGPFIIVIDVVAQPHGLASQPG